MCQQSREWNARSIAGSADQLFACAHHERARRNANLRKDVPAQVRDERVIDPHGTFEMATAAGGAIVEGVRHFLDLLVGKSRITQDAGAEHS